jgi:murein DD-endopeptidase MepM/ murein hydrolase activator NlpD
LFAVDYISEDKARWKIFFRDLTPAKTVTEWKLPFKTNDRNNLKTMSVISTFGSARNSFKSGHFHTGLDCINKNQTEPVDVYSMAEGVVVSVHLADPHQTVVIKHKLKDGTIIFSSYKHINEVEVKVGDEVTANTKIARVLTKKEAKVFKGNFNHLHLEIRKNFDDYGCASWLTMTKEELIKRFYDPLVFMKESIK